MPVSPDDSTPAPTSRAGRRASRRRRRPLRLALLGGLLVAVLVATGVWMAGREATVASQETLPTSAVGDRVDTRGGTLHALSLGPVASWDPQRIATRDTVRAPTSIVPSDQVTSTPAADQVAPCRTAVVKVSEGPTWTKTALGWFT